MVKRRVILSTDQATKIINLFRLRKSNKPLLDNYLTVFQIDVNNVITSGYGWKTLVFMKFEIFSDGIAYNIIASCRICDSVEDCGINYTIFPINHAYSQDFISMCNKAIVDRLITFSDQYTTIEEFCVVCTYSGSRVEIDQFQENCKILPYYDMSFRLDDNND